MMMRIILAPLVSSGLRRETSTAYWNLYSQEYNGQLFPRGVVGVEGKLILGKENVWVAVKTEWSLMSV